MPAPAPAPSIRGRFLWHELATIDVEGAKAFYTKAVGWGAQRWEGATAMPYTVWLSGDNQVGGLMELPQEARAAGAPPHWLAYVGTPDVDGTLDRAKTLGSSVILEPMDVPEVGRLAIFKDPQGAVIAVYNPASEPKPEIAEPPAGTVSWHELATTDADAAWRFYQNLFGWEETASMDMGPGGTYRMYGRSGITYGGIYNKPPDMPMPSHWLLYIRVDDVNAAIPRVKDNGGQVLNGPMEVAGGDLIAQCLDPQGAAFAIHSKKKA